VFSRTFQSKRTRRKSGGFICSLISVLLYPKYQRQTNVVVHMGTFTLNVARLYKRDRLFSRPPALVRTREAMFKSRRCLILVSVAEAV
jgi:hypothetical protein